MNQSKFTLKRESVDGSTIEYTFEADYLPEVLENFKFFLNGCSYTYIKDLNYENEFDKWHEDYMDSDSLVDGIDTLEQRIDRYNNRY